MNARDLSSKKPTSLLKQRAPPLPIFTVLLSRNHALQKSGVPRQTD